jgi:hypothetical protein
MCPFDHIAERYEKEHRYIKNTYINERKPASAGLLARATRLEVNDHVGSCDPFEILVGQHDTGETKSVANEIAVEGIGVDRMIIGHFWTELDLR